MKKAQGLSLNTIIIAAIVLIVLIVLWAIFTGRMGKFGSGVVTTQKCTDVCKAVALSGIDLDRNQCVAQQGSYKGMDFVDDQGQKMVLGCCCLPSEMVRI